MVEQGPDERNNLRGSVAVFMGTVLVEAGCVALAYTGAVKPGTIEADAVIGASFLGLAPGIVAAVQLIKRH